MKSIIIAVFLILIEGCTSINVNTVKPYEGRYESTSDIINAIHDIKLQKNESIWILTNTTLKNLLKSTNGK